MKVWLDGGILDPDRARIGVCDHGLLYGDGVFEGIRSYGRRLFRLADHLERLEISARALALRLPAGRERLGAIVRETVAAVPGSDVYARLIVTRGEGALGVDPASCSAPRIVCMADEVALFSPEIRARGLELVTSSVRRPSADQLDPRIKSLNYLPSVLAKQEARRVGADEALLLNPAGRVAEASVANVFCARHGRLATPPASEGALEGITRATVLELAREVGLDPVERPLTRLDLLAADEVLLTGTGAGIVGVRALDGRRIGRGAPGRVLRELERVFAEYVRKDAAC
ncbi:MAG: aminotransferase class IV [Myxococcota bacterium]